MQWMVTGAAGMLGRDLVDALVAGGHQPAAMPRSGLDVTDARAVVAAVSGHDVVVNCAAYTKVDDAETHEAQAFEVNATAVAVLARACDNAGVRLVHVSTDYVFDGAAAEPYPETAPLAPRSAYGRTKAAGEWAVRAECPDHLVVRTAWLYGEHGPCFPRTIARLAAERPHLEVVDDQVGQPTWTADVARVIVGLVESAAPAGTYHATSSGSTSWHGFAREVVAACGADPQMVRPTSSQAFPRPAPRPAFSVLGHERLTGAGVDPIGPWDERWRTAQARVLGG